MRQSVEQVGLSYTVPLMRVQSDDGTPSQDLRGPHQESGPPEVSIRKKRPIAAGLRMAKGKSPKPTPGQQVKVVDGVTMPEFPDLSIAGWTGQVMETTGTGAKLKVILEWDETTQARIPADYRAHCDSQGLMAAMACLPATDLEVQ